MKQIKVLLIIAFFGISSLLCAQSNKGTSKFKQISLTSISFDNTVTIGVNTAFNKILYADDSRALSVFNPITTLNDTYFLEGDDYVYSKSNVVLDNAFRVNKIDSFNPYGASNIKTAVGLGLVNSLLKEIQK